MSLPLPLPPSLYLPDRLSPSIPPRSFPCQSYLLSGCKIASKARRALSVEFFSARCRGKNAKMNRGVVCYSASIRPDTLQWACTVSSAYYRVTILPAACDPEALQGTAIHKSFLVPLVALQAPSSVVSWIQGEYGRWAAFLALLVRLFYFIPGELELPFWTLVLVIVAPYQAMSLRGTQAGAIISLAIAAFLALQHFTRAGSLQKAFDQGSILATLAIVCITVVPCIILL